LASEGIAVDVRPGAEIAAARAGQISADELQRLSLGGGQWLLVEPPFVAVVSGLDTLLLDLQSKGHRILLAHPERCPALHRDPQMLRGLVSRGVLTSITAGSLAGRFGADVRRFALALATDGLVHNVASDAHDHQRRPPSIAEELQHAGLGALSQWLTHEVPAAILDGSETIPPRPAIAIEPLGARPRSRWHSLRR
jgi:protein-tyrosine phosphatase